MLWSVIDEHMIYETKSALMIILFRIQSDVVLLFFGSCTACTYGSCLVSTVDIIIIALNNRNRSVLTVLLCWLLNKYSIWFAVVSSVYYLLCKHWVLSIEHRMSLSNSNVYLIRAYDSTREEEEEGKKMTKMVSSISVNRRLLNW